MVFRQLENCVPVSPLTAGYGKSKGNVGSLFRDFPTQSVDLSEK